LRSADVFDRVLPGPSSSIVLSVRCNAGGHDLPQDTPTPRRSSSWKPKKRESEKKDEKVVIPKAKKPITKSYIAQSALTYVLCACAALFYLLPEMVAAQVFGIGDIAFMTKGLAQFSGALLAMQATLFFVLRELPFSYSASQSGYAGVLIGSALQLKTVFNPSTMFNPLSVVLLAVIAFTAGTAIVQLKKIQTYKKMR